MNRHHLHGTVRDRFPGGVTGYVINKAIDIAASRLVEMPGGEAECFGPFPGEFIERLSHLFLQIPEETPTDGFETRLEKSP